MGKSSETFNKKEKEKKRLKKQQEKKEKAELRKADSDKGKGLEAMMAYVDEDGNITSTPPTATFKQKPVLAEHIQVGVPKQIHEPEDHLKTGTISFFNTSKGYGFIRDGKTQENVFFHVNNLNFDAKENDKVSFSVEKGPKGMNALNIVKAI